MLESTLLREQVADLHIHSSGKTWNLHQFYCKKEVLILTMSGLSQLQFKIFLVACSCLSHTHKVNAYRYLCMHVQGVFCVIRVVTGTKMCMMAYLSYIINTSVLENHILLPWLITHLRTHISQGIFYTLLRILHSMLSARC